MKLTKILKAKMLGDFLVFLVSWAGVLLARCSSLERIPYIVESHGPTIVGCKYEGRRCFCYWASLCWKTELIGYHSCHCVGSDEPDTSTTLQPMNDKVRRQVGRVGSWARWRKLLLMNLIHNEHGYGVFRILLGRISEVFEETCRWIIKIFM